MNANEFVEKFIYDLNRKHVQLELHFNSRVILQVESLKYKPYLLKLISNDNNLYKGGFVVHFTLKKEMIPEGKYYKNILRHKDSLNLIEYVNNKRKIVGFYHFVNKRATPLEIGKYMKLVIESVYGNPIADQKVIFFLRYFKNSN